MRAHDASVPVVLPSRLRGVEAVRITGDTRLWTGVSTRYGVTLVEEGAFDFWYRGRTWTQTPRELKLKEPGEVHRDLRVHAPVTGQTLSLDVAVVQAAAEELDLRRSGPLPTFSTSVRGVDVAARALHARLRHPASDPLELQSLLTELLEALLRGRARVEDARPRRRDGERDLALRARELLHASVGAGIELGTLARHTRVDRFRLLRLFRRELGMTPYAYLTHLRVARARELLAEGVPPATVAVEVGLYDQSQLHRHFVRIVGVPPGAYARAISPKKGPRRVADSRG